MKVICVMITILSSALAFVPSRQASLKSFFEKPNGRRQHLHSTVENIYVEPVKTRQQFNQFIEEHSNKIVVVNFCKSLCQACKLVEPRFREISGMNDGPNFKFLEVNFDYDKELFADLGVQHTPTVHMYRGGVNCKVEDFICNSQNFGLLKMKLRKYGGKV
uniref:Thioredoxin domain-containing protein n=1 Tax=Octactis speculum TaxID=3111310 RepID=A0A7S2BDB8_9STRA|mmetsp:Transcript_22077/g.30101  ORF Transcript_22077/g.30101 Transcript_22077/m.30101 type:complete len:161 (+) Transcript_22077:163-645(+)